MLIFKKLLYKPYHALRRAVRTFVVLTRLVLHCLQIRMHADRIIWFIATPRHGNLGDQAIVEAQYTFFTDMGFSRRIIELSRRDYTLVREFLPRFVRPNDGVVIDGGGNVGTLWIEEEEIMRDIIQRFPHNPIFIFPQTAFFEDTEFGRAQLQRSVEIYCAHPDLTVFCRDKATYSLFLQEFPGVRTAYVPDIVLYLTPVQTHAREDTALLCMRADSERTAQSIEAQQEVCRYLDSAGVPYRAASTVLDEDVPKWRRQTVLHIFWCDLSYARFVVTDRLHGMLFCAITGTSCIALDNVSRKVSGGYAWIRHLPYIRLCSDTGEVLQALEGMVRKTPCDASFDNAPLLPYFLQMRQIILKSLHSGNENE